MSGFNFNLTTWRAPHWLTVVGSAVGGAIVDYLMTIPAADLLTDLSTSTGWEALGKGALVAGLAALAGVAKTLLAPEAQAEKNVNDANVKAAFPGLKS
jgi:hypothetical protein